MSPSTRVTRTRTRGPVPVLHVSTYTPNEQRATTATQHTSHPIATTNIKQEPISPLSHQSDSFHNPASWQNTATAADVKRNLAREFEQTNRELRQAQLDVEEVEEDFRIIQEEWAASKLLRQMAIKKLLRLQEEMERVGC